MITTVFAAIAGLGGLAGISSLIKVNSERAKAKAEAKKIGVEADAIVSDQALEMYALARKEAQEAKEEAQECRRMVSALESHVDKLERIMWDNGLKPPLFKYPRMKAVES